MRFLLFLYLFSSLFFFEKVQAEKAAPLLFGAVAYPPYTIDTGQERIGGSDADLLYEVFRRLDLPIKIDLYPWKRVLQLTKVGALTGALTCSPRPADFVISDPISAGTDALYVHSSFNLVKHPLKTARDLLNYPLLRVGGVSGYKHLKILNDLGLQYDLSPDDTSAFKKLFANRLDVILSIKEYADYTLASKGLRHKTQAIPLSQKRYHLCFNKDWPNVEKLKARFNQTLLEIRQDGTYDKIQAKYK